MARKKSNKSTPAEAEAGRQNLLEYRETNPTPALKHGAYSERVRQRFDDKRTSEGRQLKAVLGDLTADLGGIANMTAFQRLLLENIRSKLIVLFQINRYVNKQLEIINKDGELLPCLGRNFTSYSEALRRDLEVLFGVKRKNGHVSYEKAMKTLESE